MLRERTACVAPRVGSMLVTSARFAGHGAVSGTIGGTVRLLLWLVGLMLELLRAEPALPPVLVMHAYGGSAESAKEYLKLVSPAPVH